MPTLSHLNEMQVRYRLSRVRQLDNNRRSFLVVALAKEGIGTIFLSVLMAVILTMGALSTGFIHIEVLAVLGWIAVFFFIYFFRDPQRSIPEGKNLILSPADGRVVEIKEVMETDFLNSRATRIGIFMSPLDVHINRIPITGRVTHFRYQKGKFRAAYTDQAAIENEQTIIGIEAENCKVLFKQIAGVLARRIVCRIREGYEVRQGEKFGMIKFGSRVDIFLTEQVELKVKLKQRVRAGESIIGVLKDDW
ncbi:MAG: phosphatidylserine decarboxylase family protein [candidate division KSB1 bacterium]|nr:phosphatidylserine decarboxylase family protein [candidate division KSB1 bacterium]